MVEWLTDPARFEAEQEYSPACLAKVPSMLKTLRCLLSRFMVILESFDESIGTELKAQEISIGMSPFETEQATDTESPSFVVSVLKAIGKSCGPTVSKKIYFLFFSKTHEARYCSFQLYSQT